MQKTRNGYEYEVVGKCERTGKPVVAPIAWSSKLDRPRYYTCSCCGRKR